MFHRNYFFLWIGNKSKIHSFRTNDPKTVSNPQNSGAFHFCNLNRRLHAYSSLFKKTIWKMLARRAYFSLKFSSRLFRSLSSKADAFDLSLDSAKWPSPLRSCSCNSLTKKNINEFVTLSGWVDSVRIMKDSVFIILRDGEGQTQTLFDCDKEGFCLFGRLSTSWIVAQENPYGECCVCWGKCRFCCGSFIHSRS